MCPRCSSPYLRQFGAGTQRVESELAGILPGLAVVRMDADTTKGKGGHERALAQFEALDAGVLLGTQMIAKGLDYPEVTLVGVINADTTLHLPDFRAGERTYQLLEQVSGRAGRGERQGRVIVQTYWPDHPAIQAAAQHEPRLFYEEEERVRAALGYPPFGRLANILFWGGDKSAVAAASHRWVDALAGALPDDVDGSRAESRADLPAEGRVALARAGEGTARCSDRAGHGGRRACAAECARSVTRHRRGCGRPALMAAKQPTPPERRAALV